MLGYMTVYIEYAFLQNFFFDGVLFTLALYALKERLCLWRIALSAALGGVFALVFPLIKLPAFLKGVLKFAGGAFLCMPLMKRLKTPKEWGRYALICLFFFAFTFLFGGSLLGLYSLPAPFWAVLIGFAVLSFFAIFLIRKLYERKTFAQNAYDCRIISKTTSVLAQGFMDSGNLAKKNGLPVCFLSPDLVYELWGEEILKAEGQVFDELAISTLAGSKKITLYEGEIELCGTTKRAYFGSSPHMISRAYKILLNPSLLEE